MPKLKSKSSGLPEKKKFCHCKPTCGELITKRSRQRHYRLISEPSTILPSQSEEENNSDSDDSTSEMDLDDSTITPHDAESPNYSHFLGDNSQVPMDVDDTRNDGTRNDLTAGEDTLSGLESDSDHGYDGLDLDDLSDHEWDDFDEDQDIPLTREEMLRELEEMLDADEEAALWDIRNKTLTEQDRDNIAAFQLKMISNMPRVAFAQMRHAFRHKLDISSHWVMIHRVAILSGIEPQWYHCCLNSCMAYTVEYEGLECCRFCKEPRLNAAGKPRRMFCYLPLIPRLQGFFMNPKKIEELRYRHNYHSVPGTISDVFDCEHYKQLCTQKIVVDGRELNHRYFSGEFDIALGFCTDSYLLFERRRKGPSATPILVDLYSLPPEIRTHLLDLLCCGVIAGPKGPKDAHSYLVPLDDELARLAHGVPTFNCVTRKVFDLHAYNLFGMGDIIAIEKILNIKGHSSLSACRSCEMKGVRNVSGGETIYYMPLAAPNADGELRESWDPRDLPLRTDTHFQQVVDEIQDAITLSDKEKLAKYHGIKGLPALRRVGSMDCARSYPWDCMHLFFENIIPNLVKLWSGKYKGLDCGREDYEIPDAVWVQIWDETAKAMKNIPSDFCRSLESGPGKFTAEAWCFWFLYMAPGLLKGRFSDPKYHIHLCELADIIKTILLFTYTMEILSDLEEKIISWVETYERYIFLLIKGIIINIILWTILDHLDFFYGTLLWFSQTGTAIQIPTMG
ncbi:hypothetical protein MSAN_00242100 [Mycena sanguinolenta]|uniref:Transposase family Tnp2 protein n=1 Tax=Mycena sanguinolenta TaxID=230812 RepID=A0A8H7DP10_9AGAR|nr:hypothetical protein MSAN_00242100 [Mycena sanguinolenta]